MGCAELGQELALPGVVPEPLDVNHRELVPWCDLVAWEEALPEEAEPDQELELLDVRRHELVVP